MKQSEQGHFPRLMDLARTPALSEFTFLHSPLRMNVPKMHNFLSNLYFLALLKQKKRYVLGVFQQNLQSRIAVTARQCSSPGSFDSILLSCTKTKPL